MSDTYEIENDGDNYSNIGCITELVVCRSEKIQLKKQIEKLQKQLEITEKFISDFKEIFEQEKDDTILSELDDLWFQYNKDKE